MLRLFTYLFSFFMLLSPTALAGGEDKLTRITGTNINLSYADHAWGGSIKEFVAWGAKGVSGEEFASLTMKKDGALFSTNFTQSESGLGGTISHVRAGETVSTKVELARIEKDTQTVVIRINGVEVPVKITADSFENGHFVNPQYTATINGEVVSFKMEDGHACYGCSAFLIMTILGAYAH